MQKVKLDDLRKIHGLTLPEQMSERELSDYSQRVDEYIEMLPDRSRELLRLFIAGSIKELCKSLESLSDILAGLYAFDLMVQCNQVAELAEADGSDKTEVDTLLGQFIGELSTLSIDIQVAQYQTGDKTYRRASPGLGTLQQAKKQIFAVDDVPIILNTLKRFLEGDKYKFSGITSGKAALQYLETREIPPDMIILDIDMPEMDGFELAVKIGEMGLNAPIMFLTSNATRDAVISAFQVGAIDFIVKPLNKQLILEKLEKYLG